MTDTDQARAFQGELEKLIERFRSEFDLSVAAAIGTLEVVKLDLWHGECEAQNEDGEDIEGLGPL